MKALVNYVKNAYVELKKVTWPTRQEAIKSTITVVIFSVVVAAFLGVIDYGFTLGLNYFTNNLPL